MSPDRDVRPGDEESGLDAYDDEEPRSIFSALWFRGLLAVLVLGVLVAVAVPYVLDFATTPALKPKPPTAAPLVASPAPAPSPAPSTGAGTVPMAPSTATAAPVPAPAETASPAPVKAAPMPPAQAPAKARTERPVVAKAVEATKPAPKAPAAKSEPDKAAAATAAGGPYWVQVGAFKDAEVAKRVAARLREQGLRVGESTTTLPASRPAAAPGSSTAPGDLYDVLVTGAPAVDIEAKLTPKGFTGQSADNGVLVRPSLALRDAVALSRELSDGGLSVQVRRVSAASPPPAAAPETGSATTLHRVRVGGFPDRATAVAAMKQLEEKGYKPFIARGE